MIKFLNALGRRRDGELKHLSGPVARRRPVRTAAKNHDLLAASEERLRQRARRTVKQTHELPGSGGNRSKIRIRPAARGDQHELDE